MNNLKIRFYLAAICLISLSSCIEAYQSHSKLPPGIWRGTLDLNDALIKVHNEGDIKVDDSIELPFNFEVVYDSETDFHIEIINGSERIKVDDISWGRRPNLAKDTIRIDFPIYDTYISAIFSENVMQGHWYVNYKSNYKIPFVAHHGVDNRFPKLAKNTPKNIEGKWKVDFDVDTEDPYPAIAEIEQKGNELLGTFLTETGDYRFLHGEVQNDEFFMSCFDGSHAFLFEGKIQNEELLGTFRSGKHYRSIWKGTKDPNFTLGDPDSLTYMTSEQLDITFENLNGELVSLSDPAFNGKAKLIQIMGTWCPNCLDETNFLLEYFTENPTDNLEVISLGFERYKDKGKSIAALRRWKEKKDIPFTILYGGYYNKKEASEKLPMLNKIISYPTLIFVDKNNQVKKIHTGFSGPATSNWKTYRANLIQDIESLL